MDFSSLFALPLFGRVERQLGQKSSSVYVRNEPAWLGEISPRVKLDKIFHTNPSVNFWSIFNYN